MARVTLKDVSLLAGVGTTTASLVLRDSPTIPDETKARVRAAMDELGYVYNRQAAMFRRQKSMAIGLVVTEIGNPYFAGLAMSLEQKIFDAGYTLLMCYSRDDVGRQNSQIRRLYERGIDALALLPAVDTDPTDLKRLVDSSRSPFVLVTRHLGLDQDYVGANIEAAGLLLGRHLADIGVRTLTLLGGPADASATHERIRGLTAAAADGAMTMTPQNRITGASTVEAGAAGTARLLDNGDLPDAIVAYSDVIATGVYAELHARGLHPGRDIAVASFDDNPGAAHQVPPLTSVATFPDQCGEICASLLLERIEQAEPGGTRHELVAPRLRIRASTVGWARR